MKKLIKLEFNNTTRERKTEDSYSELYSYDRNNGSFEFEILNETLTTEQVTALFKFTESNKVWKTTGTVEGNKVNVTFDTSLITQNETVICYLYFDEKQRTSDTYRFKFKVKVSEIDKMNRYEVKERFINNTVIVDRLDVVTKEELKEALKNVGGIATEGLLTEVKAEETYAKKSETVDNTNFELVKNRVLALELKTDKETVYDDSELKARVEVLEQKTDNDTVYDDTPLKKRVTALESKAIEGGAYDDSDLQGRVRALEERPTITYDDREIKEKLQYLEPLFNYRPAPRIIEDNEIVRRLDSLEQKEDKATKYNDTELRERVEVLENKPNVDLTNYITSEQLENKHYLTQHQSLDNLVTKEELNSKGYLIQHQNISHLVTNDELNSKGYLTEHQDISNLATKQEVEDTYAKKSTINAVLESRPDIRPYNDEPLKERLTALENRPTSQSEMRGIGMPNGVVEAPIGTTYIDTAKTNGALKWIKTTDGGNTDWKVVEGDTGWVLGWSDVRDKGINKMYLRRKNDVVHVKFEPKINDNTINSSANLILDRGIEETESALSIEGFQPVNDVLQTVFNSPYEIFVTTVGSDNPEPSRGNGSVIIQYEYRYKRQEKNGLKLQIVTSNAGVEENFVSPFSYLTEDEWPTTLPTI